MLNQVMRHEEWKPIILDIPSTNPCRFEISSLGRVRSFNAAAAGNILKGSITEGYKVIRYTLYRHRTALAQARITVRKQQLANLYEKKKALIKEKADASLLAVVAQDIATQKEALNKALRADTKKRTMYHHFLVHRMVATYFLPPPKPEETVVAHLDYDKCNNRVENLKWMTPEENKLHQLKSPFVIAEKKQRKHTKKDKPTHSKLTVTQVMLVKKELKRGVSARRLAKSFKVSDMQIIRIKKGENWAHIPTPE